MSLTSDIATLVARYEALAGVYDGKAAQINAALAAALAAAPTMNRTYYVNQTMGNDAADGTIGAPLASIKEAVRRIPFGGNVWVRLLSDFNMASDIDVDSDGRVVTIFGEGARRVMTFGTTVTADNKRAIGGFSASMGTVMFRNLELVVPAIGAMGGTTTGNASSIVRSGALSSRFISCGLYDVNLNVPASPGFWLCNALLVQLFTTAVVEIASPMAGWWVSGVPAATNPNTKANLLTNLASM